MRDRQFSSSAHYLVPYFKWVIKSFFLNILICTLFLNSNGIFKKQTLQIEVLHPLNTDLGRKFTSAQINCKNQSSSCNLRWLQGEVTFGAQDRSAERARHKI